MAGLEGNVSQFHCRFTPEVKFRILALTDCCTGTNIPWMFSAMLRGVTTPPSTDPQMELWFRISDEPSATTVNKGRIAEPVLVAIDIDAIEFNLVGVETMIRS